MSSVSVAAGNPIVLNFNEENAKEKEIKEKTYEVMDKIVDQAKPLVDVWAVAAFNSTVDQGTKYSIENCTPHAGSAAPFVPPIINCLGDQAKNIAKTQIPTCTDSGKEHLKKFTHNSADHAFDVCIKKQDI